MTQHDYPDISIIKRVARDNLAVLLESPSLVGKKDIVIDSELMKLLNTIGGAQFLKKHGIDKIFKLEPGGIDAGCDRKVYLVRPYPSRLRLIIDHIRYDREKGIRRKYIAIFTPKKMAACEVVLEEEGLYGDVAIEEYHIDFLPIDQHILSLELPDFKDLYYHECRQWLPTYSKGLCTLQVTYGMFPEIVAIGSRAVMLADLIQVTEREEKKFDSHGGLEISKVIIIDREIDFVTPLLSQLTYEGLVADTFGIHCGFVEFDKEVTKQEQRMIFPLTSEDKVFEDIRYMHFLGVSQLLASKARNIQQGYDKRKDLASVREFKEYVGQEFKTLSQQHQSLSLHLAASEVIVKTKTKDDFEKMLQMEFSLLEETNGKECIDYIEELMNKQVPMFNALRLLCLLTQTRTNLDPRILRTLKLQFLQSYGYDYLVTLDRLRKADVLLENNAKKGYFQKIRKKLNLCPENPETINLKHPNDMSYIFARGYAPLTAKVVDEILKKGAPAVDKMLKPYNLGFQHTVRTRSARVQGSTTLPSESSPNIVLVVFVGGCTHSEIAALRFLETQLDYKFLVATSLIMNRNDVINSLVVT